MSYNSCVMRFWSCFLFVLFLGHFALADASFFTLIPDVPVMPGLVERHESGSLYDKPDGRIVEWQAVARGIALQDVRTYYESVLPRFGWIMHPDGTFSRQGEILNFTQSMNGDVHIVHFSVVPQE